MILFACAVIISTVYPFLSFLYISLRFFLSYFISCPPFSSLPIPFLSYPPSFLPHQTTLISVTGNVAHQTKDNLYLLFCAIPRRVSWNLHDGVKPKIDYCLKCSFNSEITDGITFRRNSFLIIFLRGIICYLIIIQSWIILSQSVASTRVTSIMPLVCMQLSSFTLSGPLCRRQAAPSRSFP